MKLLRFCDWLIIFSFSLLFFLVPLILTPWNYELFEYNKMMLVYGLTIIIAGSWLIKMVVHKKFLCQRTPFDLPLLLFLLFQVISTFVSIDPHVSLFGYYSRFNGGLFSTMSYITLYYAFVSNFTSTVSNSTKPQRSTSSTVLKFLKISLLSALIVSLYGIAEHFGIDKNLWVQDVQNRVFSTLGQPNWLGAYLAIMITIFISFMLKKRFEHKSENSEDSEDSDRRNDQKHRKIRNSEFPIFRFNGLPSFPSILKISVYYLISALFYLCLLYTKSRSGLMGLGIGLGTLFLISFLFSVIRKRSTSYLFTSFKPIDRKQTNQNLRTENREQIISFRPFLILSTLYLILSVFVGTPWTPSVRSLIQPPASHLQLPPQGPALETGGTESGEIRKIVWQGAWDITRHYPLFGTGPETFAFAYYQFRPVAHNLVSEWDFLYNKAHNEYLNYAATTGFVGLGTYLLFIGWFLIWSFSVIAKSVATKSPQMRDPAEAGQSRHAEFISASASNKKRILNQVQDDSNGNEIATPFGFAMTISLLAGFISILITNFFGFSVVIISVYFWLIPAMVVIITKNDRHAEFISASVTKEKRILNQVQNDVNLKGFSLSQYLAFVVILLSTSYLLLTIIRFWYADVRFNRGYQLSHAGYYQQAYQPFHEAIEINPEEPFYRDELSYADAVLAVATLQQKESTLSAQLAKEAVFENQKALAISPSNVNFYKTQTKVYYTLSSLDPNSTVFNQKALQSLQKAKTLAPTDPKITYNIALLLGRLGKNQEAIKTLEEAISLKANYQDARFALALFEHEAGKKQEAISQLEYILKYLSPTDKQIQEKLKEWQN